MKILYSLVLVVITSQCAERYQPAVTNTDFHYLVIDSFADVGGDSVVVTLSRTNPIASQDKIYPELNAAVYLEDNTGVSSSVSEKTNGHYSQTGLHLSIGKRYRLHITTADRKEYVSDYTTPKETPLVDTVIWQPTPNGVSITANTHDDTNTSRYYRWTYLETWEYAAHYGSGYESINGQIIPRSPAHQIRHCWITLSEPDIIVGTTNRLSQDVVADQLIAVIAPGSQRLLLQYSILVKQQSIAEDEYEYWLQLKKTTESLGGLFDPLPGQVTGNFHCTTNTAEPVLGYFSSGVLSQKRIFITFDELPESLRFGLPKQPPCEISQITKEFFINSPSSYAIVDVTTDGSGIFVSPFVCVDCRAQGGITTKPAFWK